MAGKLEGDVNHYHDVVNVTGFFKPYFVNLKALQLTV